jgi:predicted enzyme involved in methoxymalonyl-ACP biosynthesis
MIADEGRILLAAYLRDRFGDEGLIGFVHYAGGAIVDFSLSCRAMDRTVEFAMEAELERMLLARGIGVLSARYTRMAKNAPVSDLFSSFGFETVRQEPGRTEYRLHLAGRKPLEWAGCLKGERI